eukprot:TRINITY_DN1997_c0_g1_i1.p1 TRINITY_DN1997_c0_g1~~TRINITY_DN1997_c0_g1_i1.p1  ORF type:complete len:438 (+),score=146.96 TRINITY_DN1997_c0_g1_i1:43-1356(+)
MGPPPLSTRTTRSKETIDLLNSEMTTLQNEIEELRDELHEKERQVIMYSQQVAVRDNELANVEEELIRTKERFSRNMHIMREEYLSMESDWKHMKTELEMEISTLRKDHVNNHNLLEENKFLAEENAELKIIVENLQIALTESQTEKRLEETSLSTLLIQEFNVKLKEIREEEAKKAYKQLNSEGKQALQRNILLSQNLKKRTDGANAIFEKYQEIKEKFLERDCAAEALEIELKATVRQKTMIKAQLDAVEKKNAEFLEKLKKLTKENREMKTKFENEMQKLKEELLKSKKSKDLLEKELNAYQKQYKSMNLEISKLTARLSDNVDSNSSRPIESPRDDWNVDEYLENASQVSKTSFQNLWSSDSSGLLINKNRDIYSAPGRARPTSSLAKEQKSIQKIRRSSLPKVLPRNISSQTSKRSNKKTFRNRPSSASSFL